MRGIGVLLAASLSACVATPLDQSSDSTPSVSDYLASSEAHSVLLKTTADKRIKQGYVDAPEGQIHYWEAGQGEPLLMIHQASSSSEEFAGMVDILSTHYRLITFDWPGHGLSDDPAYEFGADEYMTSGLRVLDHLGVQRAHVLGNHGGALVALNLAWKHPERVEDIILSGTSGVKDMEAVQEFSNDLGLDEMNRVDREGQSLSDAWSRYTRYMPNSSPGEILVPYFNNVMVRLRPYDAHYEILKFDRRPAYAAIKDKRILLMQAEGDPFVSDQELLLDILPNAEREVLEGVGLFNFYEAPAQAAKVIKAFLDRAPISAPESEVPLQENANP